jgi:hypothetical protein
MMKDAVKGTDEYDQVIESIQKNFYLLEGSNNYYKFNNRLLLSNSQEFLEAVKSDIGGEMVEDKAIGSFLYFGDENQD